MFKVGDIICRTNDNGSIYKVEKVCPKTIKTRTLVWRCYLPSGLDWHCGWTGSFTLIKLSRASFFRIMTKIELDDRLHEARSIFIES